MKQQKNESRLLTAVAIMVLLLSGWSPSWADDGYEVIWEHQLPYDDFRYLCRLNPNNSYTSTRTFAVSSPANNFVVYPDSYLSFKVIDLATGELIRKVIVDSVHDNPDYYGLFNMQLFEDDMKLAVFARTGYVYVYDTHSWQLIRQVESEGANRATGKISKDGTLLFEAKSGIVNVFNFQTMEQVNGVSMYVDGAYRPYPPYFVVSDDNKRIAMYTYLDGWQSTPDAHLIEAHDLETHEMLFHNELKQYVRAFCNADMSRLYQNTEDGKNKEYDINNKKWLDTFGFYNFGDFTDKVSKNRKYIFSSIGGSIYADRLSKNVKSHEWSFSTTCGFLDADDDYVIALRNITDTSATIFKFKILIEEVTPVEDISEEYEILYPNPTNSFINLKLPDNIVPKRWEIIDIRGNVLLKNMSSISNDLRIDITQLAPESYILRIYTDKTVLNYKIIKY